MSVTFSLPLMLLSTLLSADEFDSPFTQTLVCPTGSGVGTAFATYRSDPDGGRVALSLPSNGTLGEVTSLGAGPRGTGPLFTRVAARLIVVASAYLYNADESPRSFQCVLQLRPVGGAAQNVGFRTHDILRRAEDRTLTVTTGVAVLPGTYDVALLCGTGLPNPGGKVVAADLTVIGFAL